jgi:hypothetical protein
MKLDLNSNLSKFLHAVTHCEGDVFFTTPDGDVLNLKSELCRYVFAYIASNPGLLQRGDIQCKSENDLSILAAYLFEV